MDGKVRQANYYNYYKLASQARYISKLKEKRNFAGNRLSICTMWARDDDNDKNILSLKRKTNAKAIRNTIIHGEI